MLNEFCLIYYSFLLERVFVCQIEYYLLLKLGEIWCWVALIGITTMVGACLVLHTDNVEWLCTSDVLICRSKV